jgi:hypothetical protein
MYMKIGTEFAQLLFTKYINGTFVAVRLFRAVVVPAATASSAALAGAGSSAVAFTAASSAADNNNTVRIVFNLCPDWG